MKTTFIHILFILTGILISGSNAYSGNINDQIAVPEEASSSVSKAPTEVGLTFAGNYFTRKSNDNSYDLKPSIYLGPGFFIDYRFSRDITFSLQNFIFFDRKDIFEDSRTYIPGIFAKHWISPGWGYIGAGFEVMYSRGKLNGKEEKETDLMLSFILTGENVKISRNLNSIGDLRAGISLWNNVSGSEIRYSIQYSLGIGFQMPGQ